MVVVFFAKNVTVFKIKGPLESANIVCVHILKVIEHNTSHLIVVGSITELKMAGLAPFLALLMLAAVQLVPDFIFESSYSV